MPTMAWPAISQRNVVLAGVALALNVLLVIAAAGLGAIYWLPFAAGPAALFAARESPDRSASWPPRRSSCSRSRCRSDA